MPMAKTADIWADDTGKLQARAVWFLAVRPDWMPQSFLASKAASHLAGEGRGCFQALMRHWAPKVYMLHAQTDKGGCNCPIGVLKGKTFQ